MSIQHKSIPDSELHEPKGVATAANSTVYVGNGTGSGSWRKLAPTELSNMSATLTQSNRKLVSDGANGITSTYDSAYGVMAITNNTNGFTVTTASDVTLNTNTDYKILTGGGAPWAGESLFNITFSGDRLIVPVNGVYKIEVWTDLTSFPSTTAKIAVKYLINGTTYSTRKIQAKSNSAGDSGNLNGFGLISLNASDYIQLAVASSAAGSVIFNSFNSTLSLVRQLP